MPHKLAEEVAQHARLRLDFLARLLRQVERIVAQERREELILQLDGIGRRGREGVGHGLGGEQIEAVVGFGPGNGYGGMGLGFELPEIFVLQGGQLFRFRRVLGLPVRRQPNLDDGLHGRLVNDLLHRLRRACQEPGQSLREVRLRVNVRHIHGAVPLAPSVELGPEPRRPALQHAWLALHRGKQQLLFGWQQAAWRVPIEEIAKPTAEAKPGWPLPSLAHDRGPGLQIHQPLRRGGLALRGAFILPHEPPSG